MTHPGICHGSPRAYLAVCLLLLVTACSAPADTPSENGAAAPADTETQAADIADPGDDAGAEASGVPAPADGPKDASAGKSASSGTAAAAVKLSGRVTLDGPPPERRVVNMTKDATCIKLHGNEPVLDEDVIVAEDGGVKNAFVYIRRGAPKIEYPPPEQPATLDQKGCMYRPRVQGMLVGQKLLVSNSDPLTHNVRSFPVRSRPFNFGQPPETEPRERIFEEPEREIEVQCDIHRWMHAYIFVMDNPFFSVTADDGAYAIDDLPPGEYTLAVWHEKLGNQRRTITVGGGGAADVNFTFQPESGD